MTIGNEKLRWGPGYKGTLGWSGTGPAPMMYYHITANLGRVARLQSFLAGFGDEEAMYRAELDSAWARDTLPTGVSYSNIPARYGAGQRIDVALGKHVQLGVYEFVDFFGSADLTRYANPLQVYYTGAHTDAANAGNLLGGIDCNVLLGPVRVYGEFINDDITVFGDLGNPNRWAWMGGVQ